MLLALPVWADDICEDHWLTRNAIFDRAGHCFGSPLGQAIFDNSDCTASLSLSKRDESSIAEIRAFERELGCKVDTSKTALSLSDLSVRLRLAAFPIRDIFESGCIGYLGETVPLFAGLTGSSAQVGAITRGDFVLSSHLSRQGADGRMWSYYTIWPNGNGTAAMKGAGWTPAPVFSTCRQVAG
ncbi:MAG: DUF4453 domain-containing protein [Pseudomonadota bacterium]